MGSALSERIEQERLHFGALMGQRYFAGRAAKRGKECQKKPHVQNNPQQVNANKADPFFQMI